MFHTHKHTSTPSLTHSHSHSSLTLTGIPLVPLGLRRFCVAGVAQRALARGRMYALASLWRPSGVPLASLWRPSGVPLASLWCPLVSAAFASQAWTNVHWQGVACTPWRPSSVPLVPLGLRRFCVAGVDQRALARGRMYALAGVPLASLWCHLVSAAFAWQAWHTVHWQGVGCTPWRPSGVPLASLWRPSGVPLVPLGLCRFCVAGVAQRALPRGRMYALASLGLRRSVGAFCVAGVGQSAVPGGQGS